MKAEAAIGHLRAMADRMTPLANERERAEHGALIMGMEALERVAVLETGQATARARIKELEEEVKARNPTVPVLEHGMIFQIKEQGTYYLAAIKLPEA